MSKEKLSDLMDCAAANWIANDGVWFQAVEFTNGMIDAKRCNDTCSAHFSLFEAWTIKRFLNLPDNPGLEGVKRALNFRIYTRLNTQSVVDDTPNSFIFRMNAVFSQQENGRGSMITRANLEAWLNILTLQGALIPES